MGLGRILFELNLLNANAYLLSIFRRNTVVAEEVDVTGSCKGFCPRVSLSVPSTTRIKVERKDTIVLGDLIASRLVLVEIMFPIKPTDWLYITVQRQCGAQGRKESWYLKFLRTTQHRGSSGVMKAV